MDKQQEKRTASGNIYAVIKIFFTVMVCVFTGFLVLTQIFMPDERDNYRRGCRVFEAEWVQVLDDGTRHPVSVPSKVTATHGEWVTLVTTVPSGLAEGEALCFNTIWQDVKIYVGDELRVSYDTKNTRLFGANSPQRQLIVKLLRSDVGKELRLCFVSDSKYAGELREILVGSPISIWMNMIAQTGALMVIAVFLACMSLFVIIFSLAYRFINKKRLPINYLAWLIFLSAMWLLSELPIRQLLVLNVSSYSNMTYWSLVLLPFPLVFYVNELQRNRYKKFYAPLLLGMAAMVVICTSLQLLDVVQFVQMVFYIHAGIIVVVVSVICTISLDFLKKRMDYFIVAIGAYGLLLMARIEILLYYIHSSVTLGMLLMLGFLFLLTTAVINTAQDMLREEKKKQQAIAAKRLQSRFLANMSHEIRTPINTIIGMNQMILREDDMEAIKEYARNAQSASSMLLGLVNDILDFSKIEAGQLTLVENTYNTAELIQAEILLLRERVSKKPIELKLDIDAKLPAKLYGDELRIKQIITNLLSNAVKYTQEGSIEFSVSCQSMDSECIILCFSVKDTGIGIQKEDFEKLFDSFKRLEEKKNRTIEGTGLGLNIVKQLTDLMNGTIEVESEYGAGSAFTVLLPQRVVDASLMGNSEAVWEEKKKRPEEEQHFTAPEAKILAVDDNQMNLAVLKGFLKRSKAQLDLARSGWECLQLTRKTKYDVILMDHMMPDMDGLETLESLRKDKGNPNHDTAVIALTANAVAGSREQYMESGFDEYVSKPIVEEQLKAAIISCLPERLLKLVSPTSELIVIDKELGLSYAMNSEELYQEIQQAFCEQVEEYLPQLAACFQERNLPSYAILMHALKGNARNIGAVNFSEFAKKQELAAKAGEESALWADYEIAVKALRELTDSVKAANQ